MQRTSNPFAEPLLIAFLATVIALIVTAAMIIWRLSVPGEKAVAEFTLYGSLITVFTGALGALGQALSRDPATARLNAQAAATNATSLAAQAPAAGVPQDVQVVNRPAEPIPVTQTGDLPPNPSPPPPDRPGGPT